MGVSAGVKIHPWACTRTRPVLRRVGCGCEISPTGSQWAPEITRHIQVFNIMLRIRQYDNKEEARVLTCVQFSLLEKYKVNLC